MAAVINRWGRIDALVNNAGISTFTGAANWDVLDTEVFNRIYAVNTIGTFQMVRASAPHLKQSANAAIVKCHQLPGARHRIGRALHCVKGAVNALTLYLARELAPEIRVNAVCPA